MKRLMYLSLMALSMVGVIYYISKIIHETSNTNMFFAGFCALGAILFLLAAFLPEDVHAQTEDPVEHEAAELLSLSAEIPEPVPYLADIALNDGDWMNRKAALIALSRLGDSAADALIQSILRIENDERVLR